MVKAREYDLIDDQVIVIYDKMFPLYIVKGKKNFLIDSGVAAKAEEFYTKINRVLAETGGSESEGIQCLLLTHTHFDHTGAAFYLQKKYGFDVICSQRGVKLLQKNKVVEVIDRLNRDYTKMINSTADVVFEKLENLQAVSGGDRISVDDSSYFEVIEVPGHTQCSIGFLLHPGNIFFVGDCTGIILESGEIRPIFLSSYAEYERSLLKLFSIEIEVLALPHNRFIRGRERVRRHLENSLRWTRQYRDEIAAQLEKEPDISKIAEALYEGQSLLPGVLGSRESLLVSLETMVKAVRREISLPTQENIASKS